MARIRTIKPEFWRNEALSELPEGTHMLAAALLNYADDEGYFNANPKLIQGELFPLRDLSVTIPCGLTELSRAGYLRLGTGDDGRRYGHIIKFLDHQVINRPTESKIKDLPIVWGPSVIDHGVLSEPSLPERKGKEQGKEQGKEKEQGTRESARVPAGEFEEWYAAYPKHVGVAKAREKYRAARKKASQEVLLAGAKREAAKTVSDPKFIPHPATWLHQERWLDEEVKVKPGSWKSNPMLMGVK
jgi:hypothetical protein